MGIMKFIRPMLPLNEILDWSKQQELAWICDALRRIATQPTLTESDIEELTDLCKVPHGLCDGAISAIPLAATHLATTVNSGPVCITAVTHVSDVNALAPNETVTFAKNGLTVIYGDNGAGKSGYSRILKRCCRARGSGDAILANALSDAPAGTPTAKLTVAVGENESECTWKDGAPGPVELSAISVFDSSAAQVYVSDKTEVRFRPLGLDVLDKLATVCAQVKSRLEEERGLLQAQTIAWPEVSRETEAGQLLFRLTALTSKEQVDRVTMLSADEQKELATLTDVLTTARNEDPVKKARELNLKAGRLKKLLEELQTLSSTLGLDSLTSLLTIRKEAETAKVAADKMAHAFSREIELKGIETPAWRELWEAGRRFSEGFAYPTRPFPHIAEDAKCVLCQQDLNSVAMVRLNKLEEFVRGELQMNARTKQRELETAMAAVLSWIPGDKTKDALDDLATLDSSIFGLVSKFLDEARHCQFTIREGSSPNPVGAAPIVEVEAIVIGIESRAAEMARAADPTFLKQAETRHAELYARNLLTSLRPQIFEQIDRMARINAYERCIKDTDTRGVTSLSASLTKKYVTDALSSAFEKELESLGLTAPELELRPVSAQKGVLYHQVQLKHATRAQLPKVVSEGEGRCIALAAFLAEVGCAPYASAIVFDDPVSSLSHLWRTNVARRLVEEAKRRQVIVFTHELVFLSALLHEAESKDVPHSTQTIARGSDRLAGHVEVGLPWTGMSTQKRIGALRDCWQQAEKIHRTESKAIYEPIAIRLYADLRRTWERAVEEVLLNDTVLRFRQSVETSRLKQIGEITSEELEAVEKGMTKCSKWEGGHDQALAVNEPVPAPNEIEADIDFLDNWVKAIRKRRK